MFYDLIGPKDTGRRGLLRSRTVGPLAATEWLRERPNEPRDTPAIPWEVAEIEADLHRNVTNRDRINSLAVEAIIAGTAVELDATIVTSVDDFRTLDVPTESYG